MKSSRPQILFLVHRLPYPPNRGDRIRSYRLLEFLAERSDVHLAFLTEQPVDDETRRVLGRLCAQVTWASVYPWARRLRAGWSLATGRTATEGLFRCPALARAIRAWSKRVRYDAVVVFCSSMAQYLDAAGLEDVPVIVDLVDVDSQKWFDYAATSRGLHRLLFSVEGRRLRRLEGSLPRRAQAITLVSQAEVDLFRSFCLTGRVAAIPNGVDLDYFRPMDPLGADASSRCVFVGALDYRANIDGVTWFCDEVWPAIRRRCPAATFQIVGSNPAPVLRRLARLPGVELVGQVSDVCPYVAAAAVVVVPLRVARGIQNKVLEAMAMGKAVVASRGAVEGIGADPAIELRCADTPSSWADAVVDLLSHPATRLALGRAGRCYVERHHSWRANFDKFAALPGLGRPRAAQPAEPVSAFDIPTLSGAACW